MKNIRIFSETFSFLVKFSIHLNRRVCVMAFSSRGTERRRDEVQTMINIIEQLQYGQSFFLSLGLREIFFKSCCREVGIKIKIKM